MVLANAGCAPEAHALFWPSNGSLSLQLAKLPPLVIPGSTTADLDGTSPIPMHFDTIALPASPYGTTPALVQSLTTPPLPPIHGWQLLAHNLGGTFSGAPFGGVLPLQGVAKLCLFGACGGSGNLANLSVPLNVAGAGGTATVPGAGSMPSLTVRGAAWTTGTAAVGTLTVMGSPISYMEHLPYNVTSATVTLVTPIFISTSLSGAEVVPMFATLWVQVVPEPTTLLLLGLGITSCAVAGRRRTDARRRRAA
jgi:hypothetical protein